MHAYRLNCTLSLVFLFFFWFSYQAGWWTQFRVLFHRSVLTAKRDKTVALIRIVQFLVSTSKTVWFLCNFYKTYFYINNSVWKQLYKTFCCCSLWHLLRIFIFLSFLFLSFLVLSWVSYTCDLTTTRKTFRILQDLYFFSLSIFRSQAFTMLLL